jgi:4a-hydroxytetrahydrobiopterin dehydratase
MKGVMKTDLTEKKCGPCTKDTPRLQGDDLAAMKQQLDDKWKVVGEHHLEKEYTFKNFKDALAFTNRIGAIAEEEGHHPDIFLGWGKVKLEISTHSIGGLSENDFILAARADAAR